MRELALFVACLAWAGGDAASTQPDAAPGVDCLVRVYEEVRVPAPREGLVAQLHARRGREVKAGDDLVLLDQTDALLLRAVAEAEYERAVVQANNEGRLRAAEAARQLAQTEWRLIQELGDDALLLERARSQSALVRSDADLAVVRGELENSRKLVHVRQSELELARRDIADRRIVAPISGIVREVDRQQGEWVRRGDTVLTLTRMDRLLLEAFVDSRIAPPHRVSGAIASARLEIADGEYIDLDNLRLQATAPRLELDGKYLVWAEFDNLQRPDQAQRAQWVVRPGMKGRLEIRGIMRAP